MHMSSYEGILIFIHLIQSFQWVNPADISVTDLRSGMEPSCNYAFFNDSMGMVPLNTCFHSECSGLYCTSSGYYCDGPDEFVYRQFNAKNCVGDSFGNQESYVCGDNCNCIGMNPCDVAVYTLTDCSDDSYTISAKPLEFCVGSINAGTSFQWTCVFGALKRRIYQLSSECQGSSYYGSEHTNVTAGNDIILSYCDTCGCNFMVKYSCPSPTKPPTDTADHSHVLFILTVPSIVYLLSD
eukprot:693666_1